jgi:NADH-quinone oxidoreductase subunit L
VLGAVFVTSFYSFRLLYLTFHGKERFRDAHDDHGHGHEAHAHDDHAHDDHGHGAHEPHESPWVVTVPLILLAIPSIAIGFLTIGPMLFGTDWMGHHAAASIPGQALTFFSGAIDFADPARDTVMALKEEFHGPVKFALHGMTALPFWLALAGFLAATGLYIFASPELPARMRHSKLGAFLANILDKKYWMDTLWIGGFAGGGVALGDLSNAVDSKVIDGVAVNGSARLVGMAANLLRRTQSGFLYHYAFAMILGLIALLAVLIKFWQ